MGDVIELLSSPEPPNRHVNNVSERIGLSAALNYSSSKKASEVITLSDDEDDCIVPIASKSAPNGHNDLSLSDDFDDTLKPPPETTKADNIFGKKFSFGDLSDIEDDIFGFNEPKAKKARLSPSPKQTLPKASRFQRSISDVNASTRKSSTNGDSSRTLKRSSTIGAIPESDPIQFTSSPDPFKDAAKQRKGKAKESSRFDDDTFDPNSSPKVKSKKASSRIEGKYGTFDMPSDLDSDSDLPELGSIAAKAAPKASQKGSKKAIDKLDAERNKEKKVLERAEKAREKEAEKERKKSAKEEKALEKVRAAELTRVNVLRSDKKKSAPELIVDLPSSLAPELVGHTQRFLKEFDIKYSEWESDLPVIKWRRDSDRSYNEELNMFVPTVRHIKEEKHVIYYMTAKKFVDLVTSDERSDMDAHVLRLQTKFDGCTIIYLIEGLMQWQKKNRNVKNRKFTDAVRSHDVSGASAAQGAKRKRKDEDYVDEDLIDDALLKLQINHKVLVHHTNAMIESAEWILTFTFQISTIPYRKQKDSLETAFCMDPGQIKAGDDAADTFIKMLEAFKRITAPIAYGIASEYPTAQKLVKGLEKEGQLALEDIMKSANRDGAVTDRRIGSAISKRVYKVFTGSDPASTDV